MELGQVTGLDVRQWREGMLDCRARPATANKGLAALRSFFGWAMECGVVQVNPTQGIRNVREQAHGPRWLERGEQRAVVRELEIAVNGSRSEAGRWLAVRDRALVVLMLQAGLRVSEAAGARLADLEINGRSGSLRVVGKGRKVRDVPLNADVRAAIRGWLEVRPAGGELVFVSQKGGGLDASAIWRRVARYGQRAGVEVSPHRLRHSCVKTLVDVGTPLHYAAAIAGHESLQTTARYAQPSAHDLAQAVERAAWQD